MNWNEIQGFDGWSAALERLIAELADAVNAQDFARKDAGLQDLRDYIKHSPNDVAGPLDDIALRTVLGVIATDWQDGAEELATRSAELAKLTKQIRAITEDNVAAAEGLRLTRIREVVDGSTDALRRFGDLKAQLEAEEGADAKAVVTKIKAAIKAVQSLRNAVEAL